MFQEGIEGRRRIDTERERRNGPQRISRQEMGAYWWRIQARLRTGMGLQQAHSIEAWALGNRWARLIDRRPGISREDDRSDNNYYGTPDCLGCTADALCPRCKLCHDRNLTPVDVFEIPTPPISRQWDRDSDVIALRAGGILE